jgi:excinuclease ABC subunit C
MKQEIGLSKDDLRSHVSEFPTEPGVYIMKNSKDKVIYVGKAKNLRSRVRSYFSGDKDVKTAVLVKKINRVEYILTRNEFEALLLENNLIKKWKPRYNVNLKDGKSYPMIRVTADDFPRVFRTRTLVRDGSQYFGPFTNVQMIDKYLELVEKLFPLRKCRGKLKKRYHPCLYYHIGRCSAPCAGLIEREEYLEQVRGVVKLLSGDTDELAAEIKMQMDQAVAKLEFEKAAEHRDILSAIQGLTDGQQVVDFNRDNRDYIACAIEQNVGTCAVFQMREGRLQGSDLFHIEAYTTRKEILHQFILQYYNDDKKPPKYLYLQENIITSDLKFFFNKELESETKLMAPQKGRHSAILAMAYENARQDLARTIRRAGNTVALDELQQLFGLEKRPNRIEGFDIAQLSGKHPVASMVSFLRGNPDTGEYRRFHIRSLHGQIDDYKAIKEVVARRLTRLLNENQQLPNLLLIDGGRGQLNAAASVVNGLKLKTVHILALAKKNEEIYSLDSDTPLRLPDNSEALKVLQQVRDEAHRFATSFNKALRKKDINVSVLEGVPGIGPQRSRKLLETFGSIETIRETPDESVMKAGSLSQTQVKNLKHYLEEY